MPVSVAAAVRSIGEVPRSAGVAYGPGGGRARASRRVSARRACGRPLTGLPRRSCDSRTPPRRSRGWSSRMRRARRSGPRSRSDRRAPSATRGVQSPPAHEQPRQRRRQRVEDRRRADECIAGWSVCASRGAPRSGPGRAVRGRARAADRAPRRPRRRHGRESRPKPRGRPERRVDQPAPPARLSPPSTAARFRLPAPRGARRGVRGALQLAGLHRRLKLVPGERWIDRGLADLLCSISASLAGPSHSSACSASPADRAAKPSTPRCWIVNVVVAHSLGGGLQTGGGRRCGLRRGRPYPGIE